MYMSTSPPFAFPGTCSRPLLTHRHAPPPAMTSAIRNARKRLFAQDLDVQKYAAKDKADEDHLAPPSDEGDRTDRRKRDVPPGLSDRDAAILGTVKRRANVLDKDFSICGVKFGWTVIIDLVPGVGDAVHPALGYLLIVRHARKAKIPRALTQRMILNLAISASIGIVPGMGAILLAGYRVNVRNARLLEKFLLQRGERAAAAKAAQSGATNEKRSTGRDGDHDDDDPDAGDGDGDGDKRRGSSSGQGAEDVGSSLSDARL
ncbi:hypothetical protein F5148DRAFT_1008651, partial [Russula earlei]